MIVHVKLYGIFQKYAPKGQQEFHMDLPHGATIGGMLGILKIPPDQDRILLVNGRQREQDRVLESGDTIVIFPPLAGG
jgi:molybdopterin converting factor small subunit